MSTNSKRKTPSSSFPLRKLLPPDEIPSPPINTSYKYKIDVRERLVRADFSRDER